MLFDTFWANAKDFFLWVQKDCPDYFRTHVFFSVSNLVLVTVLVIITNTNVSSSDHTSYQIIVPQNYKIVSSNYVTTIK